MTAIIMRKFVSLMAKGIIVGNKYILITHLITLLLG